MPRGTRRPVSGAHRLKLRWPFLFAASGALFLLAGASTVRESYREWKVDQEIHQMQTEVERLEGRKLTLVELIRRLDSPDAMDKEARTRLGLRQQGERVIILRGAEDPATWQETGEDLVSDPQTFADERTNARRWFDYFFPVTRNP
jgi:cell division protein FtsB